MWWVATLMVLSALLAFFGTGQGYTAALVALSALVVWFLWVVVKMGARLIDAAESISASMKRYADEEAAKKWRLSMKDLHDQGDMAAIISRRADGDKG